MSTTKHCAYCREDFMLGIPGGFYHYDRDEDISIYSCEGCLTKIMLDKYKELYKKGLSA